MKIEDLRYLVHWIFLVRVEQWAAEAALGAPAAPP